MGIMDKIHKLQEKIGEKIQGPCPIGVLLRIGTGREAYEDVEPWYGTIKHFCASKNRNYRACRKALICALYPEMEQAFKMYDEKMKEKTVSDGAVSKEEIMFIEHYVRIKCRLKSGYNFLGVHLSDEQRERYEQLCEKFNVEDMKNKTGNMLGIVKVIAEGLAKEGLSCMDVLRDLRMVNRALLSTIDEKVEKPSITEERLQNNIAGILKLRRVKALDENYNVVDFSELQFANVIKNFETCIGDFDLRGRISEPNKEITKTQGVDVKNLSQLQNNP